MRGLSPVGNGSLGPGAWEGSILRLPIDPLGAGESRQMIFSAVVREDAPDGGILFVEAALEATGIRVAEARVTMALPPAELPATGECGGHWIARLRQ